MALCAVMDSPAKAAWRAATERWKNRWPHGGEPHSLAAKGSAEVSPLLFHEN